MKKNNLEQDQQAINQGRSLSPIGSTTPRMANYQTSFHSDIKSDGKNKKQERVKVFVRLRPFLEEEYSQSKVCSIESFDSKNKIIQIRKEYDKKVFNFDGIFEPKVSQKEVFTQVAAPVIQSVIQGFNGTILAYGQTGTGKTFTMLGKEKEQDSGIIPRSFKEIFETTEKDTSHIYSVQLSCVQIYMEMLQDLINPENRVIRIRESPENGVFISGVEWVIIQNTSEALQLLEFAEKNRAVAFTALNACSSRSHVILMVQIQKRNKKVLEHHQSISNSLNNSIVQYSTHSFLQGEDIESVQSSFLVTSVLYLVDLAGSERVKKSKSTGDRLHEAKAINSSLSALGKCIQALSDGKGGFVPFRESKLTRLLQDSLGGNSKTSLVINIGPAVKHIDETLSSLGFGQRAMKVSNIPVVNIQKDYYLLSMQLQQELDGKDDQIYQLEIKGQSMFEKMNELQNQLGLIVREKEELEGSQKHLKMSLCLGMQSGEAVDVLEKQKKVEVEMVEKRYSEMLKKTEDEYKSFLEEVDKTLLEQEEEIDHLKEQNNIFVTENEELKDIIKAKEDEITVERENSEKQLVELTVKMREIDAGLKEREETYRKWQNEWQMELESYKEREKLSSINSQKEKEGFEKRERDLIAEKEKSIQDREVALSQNRSIQESFKQIQEQKQQLLKQVQEMNELLNQKESSLKQKEDIIGKKQQEIQKLEETDKSNKEIIKQRDQDLLIRNNLAQKSEIETQKIHQAKDLENQKLKENIGRLSEELEECERAIRESNEEKSIMMQQLEIKIDELIQHNKKEVSAMKKQVGEKEICILQQKQDIEQLQNQLGEVQEDFEEDQEQLAELAKKLEDQTLAFASERKLLTEAAQEMREKQEQEVAKNSNLKTILENEIGKLKELILSKEQLSADVKQQNLVLNTKVQVYQERIIELEGEKLQDQSKLFESINLIEELKAQIINLSEELEKKGNQCQCLEQRIEDLLQQIEKKKEQLIKAETQNKEIKEESYMKDENRKQLSQMIDQLKEEAIAKINQQNSLEEQLEFSRNKEQILQNQLLEEREKWQHQLLSVQSDFNVQQQQREEEIEQQLLHNTEELNSVKSQMQQIIQNMQLEIKEKQDIWEKNLMKYENNIMTKQNDIQIISEQLEAQLTCNQQLEEQRQSLIIQLQQSIEHHAKIEESTIQEMDQQLKAKESIIQEINRENNNLKGVIQEKEILILQKDILIENQDKENQRVTQENRLQFEGQIETIESLQSQITSLEDNINQLSEQNLAKADKLSQLTQQVSQNENIILSKDKEISAHLQTVSALNQSKLAEAEQSKSTISQLQEKLSTFTFENEKKQMSNEQLISQIEEVRQHLREVQSRTQILQEELSQKNQIVKDLENSVRQQSLQIEKSQDLVGNLQYQISAKEQLISEQMRDMEEKKKQVEQALFAEVNDKESIIKEYKDKFSEQENIQKQLDEQIEQILSEFHFKIGAKTQEMETLSIAFTKLQQLAEEERRENSTATLSLKAELEECYHIMQTKEQEKMKTFSELEQISLELQEKVREIKEMEELNQNLKDQITKKEEESIDISKRIRETREENELLLNQVNLIQTELKTTSNILNEQNNQKQSQNTQLQQENNNLKNQITQIAQNLDSENEQLRSLIEAQSQQLSAFIIQKNVLSKQRAEVTHSFLRSLVEKSRTIEQLSQSHQRSNLSIDELEQQLAYQLTHKSHQEKAIDHITYINEQLHKKLSDTEVVLSRKQDDFTRLLKEKAEQAIQLNQHSQRVQNLREQLNETSQRADQLQYELHTLKTEMVHANIDNKVRKIQTTLSRHQMKKQIGEVLQQNMELKSNIKNIVETNRSSTFRSYDKSKKEETEDTPELTENLIASLLEEIEILKGKLREQIAVSEMNELISQKLKIGQADKQKEIQNLEQLANENQIIIEQLHEQIQEMQYVIQKNKALSTISRFICLKNQTKWFNTFIYQEQRSRIKQVCSQVREYKFKLAACQINKLLKYNYFQSQIHFLRTKSQENSEIASKIEQKLEQEILAYHQAWKRHQKLISAFKIQAFFRSSKQTISQLRSNSKKRMLKRAYLNDSDKINCMVSQQNQQYAEIMQNDEEREIQFNIGGELDNSNNNYYNNCKSNRVWQDKKNNSIEDKENIEASSYTTNHKIIRMKDSQRDKEQPTKLYQKRKAEGQSTDENRKQIHNLILSTVTLSDQTKGDDTNQEDFAARIIQQFVKTSAKNKIIGKSNTLLQNNHNNNYQNYKLID